MIRRDETFQRGNSGKLEPESYFTMTVTQHDFVHLIMLNEDWLQLTGAGAAGGLCDINGIGCYALVVTREAVIDLCGIFPFPSSGMYCALKWTLGLSLKYNLKRIRLRSFPPEQEFECSVDKTVTFITNDTNNKAQSLQSSMCPAFSVWCLEVTISTRRTLRVNSVVQ